MINVTCVVKNYDDPAKTDIKIHAHWNQPQMVVIDINGEKYTVIAKDLKAAIDNCVNTNRYG